MPTLLGIDGCPSGWICIFEELPSRRLGSRIFRTIDEVIAAAPTAEVIAIDIPIGLTDAGARACDTAARKFLGPKRGTSVFPAPIRSALRAVTYTEATAASVLAQQKKISKQAWMIYPKIRELDDLLLNRPELRERIYEVHPEVSFAAWNGSPVVAKKKSVEGAEVRKALVAAHFGADAFSTIRARYKHGEAANDDIIDAFAALWTAKRIIAGTCQHVSSPGTNDSLGLPMRIVY